MKKNIRISTFPTLKTIVAAAWIGLTGLTTASAQDTKGQTVVASTTVTATVTKIDQKTREVTVKTEAGKEYSFVAGDHVKNLAQVKVGDIITAVYTEALAYEVKKHGATGVSTAQAAAGAKPGEKPAGVVAQQTTVTVTVTAMDPNVPSVTFKGPKGNSKTIKIRDAKNLNGVKVGDLVDITYTEAFAVKVDEAPKK